MLCIDDRIRLSVYKRMFESEDLKLRRRQQNSPNLLKSQSINYSLEESYNLTLKNQHSYQQKAVRPNRKYTFSRNQPSIESPSNKSEQNPVFWKLVEKIKLMPKVASRCFLPWCVPPPWLLAGRRSSPSPRTHFTQAPRTRILHKRHTKKIAPPHNLPANRSWPKATSTYPCTTHAKTR